MRAPVWPLLLLVVPRLAAAQEIQLDSNNFRPAPGNGYFGAESARLLPHLQLGFQAYLSFADQVVQVVDNITGDQLNVVARQLATHLTAGLGIKDRLELGVSLPVALTQQGDARDNVDQGPQVQGTAIGDLRLSARARLWGAAPSAQGQTLAATAELGLPTGDEAQLFGEGAPTGRLALTFTHAQDKLSASGTLGAHLQQREAFNFENLFSGSALTLAAGASYELSPRALVLGEALANVALVGDISRGRSPVELRLGAKLKLMDGLWLPLGLGAGLVDQVAAPRVRVFAGLAFTPDLASYSDVDGDGLVRADKCPTQPETKNGFEESDGCPDIAPDADNDGVTIASDLCPEQPGPAALQGCPDQDGDLIADKDDRCTNEPEDKDSFQDEDGCPEPDNDADTVADNEDQCPTQAGLVALAGCPDQDGDSVADGPDQCDDELEDFDSFQDEDGCPDFDNDADTVADNEDKCPNQSGPATNNGCPESRITITSTSSLNFAEIKIYFDLNSDKLQPRSLPDLDRIAAALKTDLSGRKIRVEGHTDDVGGVETNQKLSERRAARVMEYLVSQGVPADTLSSEGYGMTRPLVTGKTREARSKNRRVEFVLLD